jgi:hypothetical protein
MGGRARWLEAAAAIAGEIETGDRPVKRYRL